MAYNRHFGWKYSHFGEDTKGHDVKAYGDTTGKYFFWDASANKFYLVGDLNLNGVDLSATVTELNLLDNADRIVKVAKVALGHVDTGGGIFAWANDEGADIIVQRVILDVTTKASAACTIDVGTTATNATTSSDNLIDGVDVNTAIGVFDNITDKGNNGKSKQKLANGKWVTGSVASGASAGLVGYAYIEYVVI